MAFYGCQFSFDGIPCFEYGLMVYDFDSAEEDGNFSTVEIMEDRTTNRYSPLHYGVTHNRPLVFNFTFGADINSIDKAEPPDRWELDAIARWLTGHSEYKFLEITQPDMEAMRYRCIITDLKYISYGRMPWAFTCQVTCDSPFAYSHPEEYQWYLSNESKIINFECRAASQYYYPKMEFHPLSRNIPLSIVNHSDGERVFKISSFPPDNNNAGHVIIDNENEIITYSDGTGMYDKFNFSFFRLLHGYNKLELKGDGILKLICEFPINIGG